MITTLAENIKLLIPGLELISCLPQIIPFPDVMDRLHHINKVLTPSSEAPVSLVAPINQR